MCLRITPAFPCVCSEDEVHKYFLGHGGTNGLRMWCIFLSSHVPQQRFMLGDPICIRFLLSLTHLRFVRRHTRVPVDHSQRCIPLTWQTRQTRWRNTEQIKHVNRSGSENVLCLWCADDCFPSWKNKQHWRLLFCWLTQVCGVFFLMWLKHYPN